MQFDDLRQDIRFALRSLRRNPGFAAVSVLTLGLGIGANAAIFSFFDAMLLRPLPYPEAERIVNIWEKPKGGTRNGVALPNMFDWQRDSKSFSYMAAITGGGVTYSGSGTPVQLRGARVTADYFRVFGIEAALGRTFLATEDQFGKGKVVVLSHKLWQSQFGGDRAILGRKLTLDGEPYEVVGILPPDSAFDRGFAQLWRPLERNPEYVRDFHFTRVFGRLKPGVSFDQARQEMDAVGARVALLFDEKKKGWGVTVERFVDRLIGDDLRRSLYVLMSAVVCVLLIGCANLANLTLARSAARTRELAIRASMGAGRMRLARQFLTESLVISLFGGVLGLLIGYGIMRGLKAQLPEFALPSEVNVSMDWRVLMFTLGLCVITSVLFGLAPAIQAARPNLSNSLKEGSRGSGAGAGKRRFRNALVVGELAMAFALLASAGLLIRSFVQMQGVDLGVRITNVVAANIPVQERFANTGAQMADFHRNVLEKLRAIPGVESAALTTAVPMEGWSIGMPYRVAGRAQAMSDRRPAYFKVVSPSYFETLGAQILKGRALSDVDRAGAPPAAVINETLAKREFGTADPVGKVLLVEQLIPGKNRLGPEVPWQVVGVVKDEMVNNVTAESSAGVYVTFEQSPMRSLTAVVRGAVPVATLTSAMRAALADVNREQAMDRVRTLETVRDESLGPARLRTMLLAVFSGVALLLAAIGTYGVISYSVVQRTHEFGVRSALGATGADILKIVVGGGLRMALLGLTVGAFAAWGATKLIGSLLFRTPAFDVWTFASVLVLLLGVALSACFVPGRRAARVDPVQALRYE